MLVLLLLVVVPDLHQMGLALMKFCRRQEAKHRQEIFNRTLTVTKHERVFDLEMMAARWESDANMEADFRFDLKGLQIMEVGLGIPDTVCVGDRDGHWGKVVTKTEILLIILQRMCRMITHRELGNTYGLQASVIGVVVNYGLENICHTSEASLGDMRRWVHYVPTWAEAVDRKTDGVFTQIHGFIDVLIQRIAKSSNILVHGGNIEPQRYYYCGYKGFHAIKWQGVESPCGILPHFSGAAMGSTSDSTMMYQYLLLFNNYCFLTIGF